jgi:hypothetical protein
VLENLSFGFLKPNILDVKLGTVLYDDTAPPDKVARMEKATRNTTSFETGVRLTGFQVSFFISVLFLSSTRHEHDLTRRFNTSRSTITSPRSPSTPSKHTASQLDRTSWAKASPNSSLSRPTLTTTRLPRRRPAVCRETPSSLSSAPSARKLR